MSDGAPAHGIRDLVAAVGSGPTNGRHLTRDEWIAGRRYLADESLRLVTTHDAPSIPFQEQENPNAYPSPCNTRLSERG